MEINELIELSIKLSLMDLHTVNDEIICQNNKEIIIINNKENTITVNNKTREIGKEHIDYILSM